CASARALRGLQQEPPDDAVPTSEESLLHPGPACVPQCLRNIHASVKWRFRSPPSRRSSGSSVHSAQILLAARLQFSPFQTTVTATPGPLPSRGPEQSCPSEMYIE